MDYSLEKKHPGFILIALFALFLIPILAAWWVYVQKPVLLANTTNHGQLIQPPLHILAWGLMNEIEEPIADKQNPLQGKWSLVLFNPGDCDQLCRQGLYQMRQIRLAMGKDRNRVENVVLTYPNSLANPRLENLLTTEPLHAVHLLVNRQRYANVAASKLKGITVMAQGTLFIVDPLGNVVMVYQPDTSADGVLLDLERLLKVSQIG